MIWATVLKVGDQYGPEHVDRLARALRRHVSDAEIVCLSDVPVTPDVYRIPLEEDWPGLGWWAKMELFREAAFPAGELVIYLDLDTAFTGDPSFLAEYGGTLACLRDAYRWDSMIGSGILLFRPPVLQRAWEIFSADPEGVQREHPWRMDYYLHAWLTDADKIQDLWPGRVVSFKAHVRPAGRIPEDTRIVCFHGNPGPDEIPPKEPVAAYVEEL